MRSEKIVHGVTSLKTIFGEWEEPEHRLPIPPTSMFVGRFRISDRAKSIVASLSILDQCILAVHANSLSPGVWNVSAMGALERYDITYESDDPEEVALLCYWLLHHAAEQLRDRRTHWRRHRS